jgi:hypothetical protein
MGSRLLPLCLVLGAMLADTGGAHRLGGWLVLAAIPCAAAAAIVAIGDLLEAHPAWIRTTTSIGALVLLLLGSAVREGAPAEAAIPALAISAVVGAAILYAVPVVLWVLQPAALRPAANA